VPVAIFDVDGTLADVSGIRHYVARPKGAKDFDRFHAESVNVPPNQDVADLARALHGYGWEILIVTARRHRWRHHTAWFLALNGIPSDALIMRADRDMRADVEVKRDMLAQIRARWGEPLLAVDDNPAIVALWAAEGIQVVEVPGWEG
jgi:phosphoglycolate phosphatase-like HAD superfamily hydrolase